MINLNRNVIKLMFLLKSNINYYKHLISRSKHDYAKTLNLPDSGNFQLSMKKICDNEEQIKKLAKFDTLYEWQLKNRSENPKFILHDGPPYSNGDIHIGHMVNKVLKDIYLRYKLLAGFRVDYKPGWDCHGLPIELNAIKSLKKKSSKNEPNKLISYNKSSPTDIRKNASEYAMSCLEMQKNSFKKMNLLADWSNIYKTIDADFMCNELDLFYKLYERNLIYRDYMPVHWSVSSQTALAEFELEYQNHKSNALYVSFKLLKYSDELKNYAQGKKIYALIWTTTIWSLPCNKAIAFNPKLKYGLLDNGKDIYLIENELIKSVQETVPFFKDSIRLNQIFDGNVLIGSTYASPFTVSTVNESPLLASDHVGSKQGTGLVHIAPALGQDDFKLGLKYNLATNCSIDERGCYSNDDEILNKYDLTGCSVFDEKTATQIKSILKENVIHEHDYIHSYPYDWRTKKPCIIRSSMQWFINTKQLKEDSLNALKNVRIRPINVSNSMVVTLSSRPYWCISRQRSWGLPIPCLFSPNDKDRKNAILNKDIIDNVKQLIKQDGNIDFWWSNKYDKSIFKSSSLKENDTELIKSSDIFDIWFDSGSSFNTILQQNQESISDLYCEGTDQFSGWFQSSLLLSIALNKKSPYKNLLVHGFVVDESNRKMSKSVGNVIEPIQAIQGIKNKLPQSGLDVLRIWIAHEYYKPQIQIGPSIMESFIKRVFEIRSLLRFMVGNLNDLDNLSEDLISYNKMMPIDKYILNRLNDLLREVVSNYDDINLSSSLLLTENFFLTELSKFYIRSVKDRLYCDKKNSLERRSAQTALYYVLNKTLLILGPILPHLAEEAFHYSVFKKKRLNDQDYTLFRSEFNYDLNIEWSDKNIDELFEIINNLRTKYFELIKSSNSSIYQITLACNPDLYSILNNYNEQTGSNSWMIECFSCSDIILQVIEPENQANISNEKFIMKVNKIDDKMNICSRCRKYNCPKINDDTLCVRCKKCISN